MSRHLQNVRKPKSYFLVRFSAAITIAFIGSTPAAYALKDERLNGQLLKLDPATRLEQTCDTEVMLRINRENRKFGVDKVIAYTFGDTTTSENMVEAPGAVLRSRGQWYRLQYVCRTGPRHLDAHELKYKIGPVVPRSKWKKYYLYD
ncbi:DUF930 domain-containing protein [Neorhizobium sp. NCHU2750]|uniref:DUF930 domain-containing protein n=1 Tax=Neorhizobium sp. NCHU2750 TaxID=1825976 RepID=UPI000E74EBD8|nr:hypothetical protein NCHU2750_52800 [Neorhizobium sp. NCHU2750]